MKKQWLETLALSACLTEARLAQKEWEQRARCYGHGGEFSACNCRGKPREKSVLAQWDSVVEELQERLRDLIMQGHPNAR